MITLESQFYLAQSEESRLFSGVSNENSVRSGSVEQRIDMWQSLLECSTRGKYE